MKYTINRNYSPSDIKHFNKLYRKTYPGILPSETVNYLHEVFDNISDDIIFIAVKLYKLKTVINTSRFAHLSIKKEFTDRYLFTDNRSIWLLSNKDVSFSDSLAQFIIDKNDVTLSSSDYALLFYVSLEEDKEVQESLKGLPLSMLYDVYDPHIKEAIKKWDNLLERNAN
jgi:hypothetical protein